MITEKEYSEEVEATASYIIELATENLQADGEKVDRDSVEDMINDSLLHEQVDGHQYAIYYRYHLPIISISENAEYGIDNGLIDAGESVASGGIQALHAAIAYWAFYADVQERIQDGLDNLSD